MNTRLNTFRIQWQPSTADIASNHSEANIKVLFMIGTGSIFVRSRSLYNSILVITPGHKVRNSERCRSRILRIFANLMSNICIGILTCVNYRSHTCLIVICIIIIIRREVFSLLTTLTENINLVYVKGIQKWFSKLHKPLTVIVQPNILPNHSQRICPRY